jgi:hypothetical protein
MSGSSVAGSQLYGRIAQLLAPPDSLENTSSLVVLEPAGKDVAPVSATGDPAGEEAFADLANAVPAAAASFLDTGRFYDDVWDLVINGAAATGAIDDPVRATVARLVADNRADFAFMARARTDVPTDIYRPVRATPKDWLGPDGWSSVSFRIGDEHVGAPPPLPGPVVIPDELPDLTWRTIPQDLVLEPQVIQTLNAIEAVDEDDPRFRLLIAETVQREVPDLLANSSLALEPAPPETPVTLEEPAPDTIVWRDVWAASRAVDIAADVTPASPPPSGLELSFEYRVVGLQRPWLKSELCHLAGWTVPGLGAGGVSNGRPTSNAGLMPVVTTRMLVVRNLVVDAHWSGTDEDRAAGTGAGTISFGPFAVTGDVSFDGTQMSRPAPQIVAWLAAVVPPCPAA